MGSPPSWPFMDFNNSLSCLLQEDLHTPASFACSQSNIPPALASSPSPSLSPSQLLSSQASLGASTGKVSKRKSRAVSKPPIRVLSADRESFRDMVQKLTGIPTSPRTLQAGRLWGGSASSAIFRPMAARPAMVGGEFSSANVSAAMAHQSMPTLDTSSAYLTRGFSNNSNLMHSEVQGNGRVKHEAVQSSQAAENIDAAASAYADQGSSLAIDGISDIESFLMGGTKLEDLLQGRIDLWHSPHVEIAHSA